jgi:hypothetical protein
MAFRLTGQCGDQPTQDQRWEEITKARIPPGCAARERERGHGRDMKLPRTEARVAKTELTVWPLIKFKLTDNRNAPISIVTSSGVNSSDWNPAIQHREQRSRR